ncbi:putative transcription regulator IWS1 family [Helianthus annuus]|nr:putative transcription regulator IWS1 family [Helianthus annuus]KAJ0574239.1 putative transcription regulator IWS1 family [Helianthus annuus]KAJ0738574.1 putative transcription regulator IWS1 family [Helianthus annuus]KAJ0912723.1 putative transcription regulator IWS1 family [Helianthus annuus]KAJ0916196.1 putative transcription regulator IWS1 family [Helianthus annuus]
MDLTFTVLKETDIEWNVNRLRKHPSNEVRGLVKQLVRKWKDLVDEWVGSNNSALARSTLQTVIRLWCRMYQAAYSKLD